MAYEGLIYLNGEFVTPDKAVVSVFDHGFLYGDGVFEGIRAYEGNVFRLKDHIDRLFDSAAVIALKIPMTKEEMSDIVVQTCAKNNLADAYIRLVVSRGPGDLGLNPRNCPKPTVICIAGKITLYPAENYTHGLRIVTASTTRNTIGALNPRIKSLNYLNNILARIEAFSSGAVEALVLNNEGYVVECTGDNVFLWRNGALLTPPTWMGALEGITRKKVMEIAEELGIPVREEPLSRYDVYSAEEMFLTGTAAELIPVVEVDTRPIANGKPGPVFQRLLEAFRVSTRNDGTKIPELS